MRVLRWIGAGLGIVLLSVAAFGLLLVAHLETRVGLAAMERVIEYQGSTASRGTMRIGRVLSMPPGPLVITDYEIIAPNGERVIHTPRMVGHLDASGLLDGQLRFRPAIFDRAEIWLTPGPRGQVNLVHASEVPEGRTALPVVYQDIRLVDNTIHVALPGKPPLTMRRVNGLADLHVGHFWQWRMDGVRGQIDLPIIEPGFRQMNGRLRSDHAHPLVIRAVVDAEIAEPAIALDYYVPALIGRPGRPYFDLDFPGDASGGGVDETEEQEEARDRLSEAREEREEVERELREERAEGDHGEARDLERELARRVREERVAREAAARVGRDEDGPSERADEQGIARERESASEDEEETVNALARQRRAGR